MQLESALWIPIQINAAIVYCVLTSGLIRIVLNRKRLLNWIPLVSIGKGEMEMNWKKELDFNQRVSFGFDKQFKYDRFSDWLDEKRLIGRKKRNRIDRRKRRIAIKKKHLGYNK